MVKRNQKKEYIFKDYPEFRPTLSPREIFALGSFGGTYWRPIKSSVTGKKHQNRHLKYPKSWWKGISDNWLTNTWDNYDKSINKYNVKVGTTLEFWEGKDWICKHHPYGWVQWYCDFFNGIRGPDDVRQIDRWVRTAGPNSRFRKRLLNMIGEKAAKLSKSTKIEVKKCFDKLIKDTNPETTISPKIRQTLQHWAVAI